MAPPRSLPGLPDDFTSKFFHGDVVSRKAEPSFRGKVIRGWADEDAPPDPVYGEPPALVRGEVLISSLETGDIQVVSELDLELFERSFLKGDFVKHSLDDPESAVVIDISSECRLEHVISGQRLVGWVPWHLLQNDVRVEAKDKVVYDEWIGTIEEVFEDGHLEARDGTIYRIAEMGGLLETGRYAKEVLPEQVEFMQQFSEFPPAANPEVDRVISVRPLIVFIVWNALNQMLPISEHEKHPEPKKFWCGSELEKLTHFEGINQLTPPLGTTVVFRKEADETTYGVVPTYHMKGTLPLKVYRVVENRIKLKLRWQDGTETEEFATGFVPYRNVDDYEAWPGEAVVWRSDTGEKKPCIVQSYNPKQRIADVLTLDTKEKETVSVLELDTGGFGKVNYGVGLGQNVLFCRDNDTPLPEVPSLGVIECPEDDKERYKQEMHRLGIEYGSAPEAYGQGEPKGDQSKVDWWGEVVDMHLDGTVSVRLYSGEIRQVGLKQLIVLNEPEGFADGGDWADDDDDVSFESEHSWETMSGDEHPGSTWDDGEQPNGHSTTEPGTADITEGTDTDFDHLMDVDNEGDRVVPAEEAQQDDADMDWNDEDAKAVEDSVTPPESADASTPSFPTPTPPPAPSAVAGPSSSSGPARLPLDDDSVWAPFDVLETAPEDHHWFKEPRQQSHKQFTSRLMKEHRALSSSLPENILVRTYEDRTDLMRVLIVGPEGTPYADAPFVFDVYLNPGKFPYEPPLVYFHSHTNGLGRCNPNLYEEGKVCLSILGTWAGDKSESWNPTKSSLLQVFVSISGLVLVKNPYHCEPAFSKLEGTREGRINSRLYSEKAYVLSRSFVRQALENPPSGLEKEIEYLYYTRGRLESVISHARRLMDKGNSDDDVDDEMAEMWNADAMGSLTMGAILTLKRTIAKLEALLAKHTPTSTQA